METRSAGLQLPIFVERKKISMGRKRGLRRQKSTMDLDVKLRVLGIATDAWVAAWDFLVLKHLVSPSLSLSLSLCLEPLHVSYLYP